MSTEQPAPRRRMLKSARLVFNGGHSALSCVLRDMSETGARVSLENTMDVPDEVQLLLDDGTRHECLVARRQLKEIGLRFR
ncbi:PilZ domain-containing protein [Rhizobium sp. SSA_523]|uniref:PilZ domain-containing protein n=1 Tax=Rhizobium sp. SSA_523 TaxID=2952477 RepID=UPI002091C68F|nr:PilZ domain-containing protein [Rhizobium sp. SSA_523]MCO5732531.1 PilZ domain-containing protein [Rhizobium sp. SSA_523]WKC22330.1 PilZ domain-containing protein [Rhizobium sp. SSA_523]